MKQQMNLLTHALEALRKKQKKRRYNNTKSFNRLIIRSHVVHIMHGFVELSKPRGY